MEYGLCATVCGLGEANEGLRPGHAWSVWSGATVAKGPVLDVLTSELVSRTFDVDVAITHEGGRFACRVRPRS